jgi:hypothetical protein
MIPTTFNEETEFLSDSNTNSLKRHYMTFYWKVRKDFLDCIEDSISHDSLIGSTISTRSKKSVSCASKISSPSVLSHDTKASKVSEKGNPHDLYPKNFNNAFLMIPTTFNEETEFLSDSNTNSLKRHYMTFYWKVRKDFLDYIEDSMSHDSLIGSTISTRSKKNISCASKISSPSVLSHDTKASKVSEKANPHDFYPKNFNHAFLMIPTTFNEEKEFLSDSNTNSLKRHYMTFYWKVRKDFLDCIEDSISHDSLIGSTISA